MTTVKKQEGLIVFFSQSFINNVEVDCGIALKFLIKDILQI